MMEAGWGAFWEGEVFGTCGTYMNGKRKVIRSIAEKADCGKRRIEGENKTFILFLRLLYYLHETRWLNRSDHIRLKKLRKGAMLVL